MSKTKFTSPVLSNIIKGTLTAVSVSLVLILIFAVLIKFLNIPDNFITPVNQVIKIISIFVGCFTALKVYKQKGLVTGTMIGLIYTTLAFLIFSLLGGNFSFTINLLIDAIFAMIIGGMCGIFSVNKKIRE